MSAEIDWLAMADHAVHVYFRSRHVTAEDREDARSAAIVGALEAIDRYQPDNPRAYAWRAMQSAISTCMQKQYGWKFANADTVRSTVPVDDALELADTTADDPFERVERHLTLRQIVAGANLKRREREYVDTFLAGATPGQQAAAAGISLDGLGYRRNLTLAKLRRTAGVAA